MKRVLIDGIMYSLQAQGGITRCFDELLTRVGQYDEELEIFFHLPVRHRRPAPRAPWIRVIRDWPMRPYRFFAPIARRISLARAKNRRPTIFHSTYYTLPPFPVPHSVVTVHDFAHHRFPALMGEMDVTLPERMTRAIESADAIIAVSETVRELISEYARVDARRIVVIPHAVDDHLFALASDSAAQANLLVKYGLRQPYWLYVGRREGYKNFATLLRAFSEIAPQGQDLLVVVGGAARFESWEMDFCVRSRMEARVRQLTGVGDDALRALYSGAQGLIFPSLDEGFGIPLLEAMACGACILASDIPVFREVARDAALFFDPHDAAALAALMRRLQTDETAREKLREAGRKRLAAFSWETSARKLAEVYGSL